MRPPRIRDGLDVVIRVIVVGDEGYDHLKIFRTIVTGETERGACSGIIILFPSSIKSPLTVLVRDYALPMFAAEFQFEDIIFGKFPSLEVGGEIKRAYSFWAKNPVRDIIEMLMQMLEVSFTFNIMPSHRIKLKAPSGILGNSYQVI